MSSTRPGRLRAWAAGLCIAGAAGLVPVAAVTVWAEDTLLSAHGFQDALGPMPADPAVETQIVNNLQRQVSAALDRAPAAVRFGAGVFGTESLRQPTADTVRAVLDSAAFQRAWNAALSAAHAELVKVLRHRSALLALTTNGLDITVSVTPKQVADLTGLPHRLASHLPGDLFVTVALVQRQDLHRVTQAVQLIDTLAQVQVPAIAALGFGGLLLTRRRGRAVIAALASAGTASGAMSLIILWGRSRGSRPITADVAVSHLAAPLTTGLTTIVVYCTLTATALAAARWIVTLSLRGEGSAPEHASGGEAAEQPIVGGSGLRR